MAKKGAMRRDPKVSTQPVRGEGEETMTDKATRRAANRAARRAPTERVSPGVYRSASGDLVTQGGRPIRRQPQATMGAPEMGQQFGQMPGQAEGVGQQLGQAAGAAGMGQQFGNMPQFQDLMYRMPPEESGRMISYFGNQGIDFNNIAPIQFGGGPTQNPWAPQMPQPSANQGGKYRLSPGVYGTREQAMRQYDQQMQEMLQPYRMPSIPQQRRG